jgi:hypothetical protein
VIQRTSFTDLERLNAIGILACYFCRKDLTQSIGECWKEATKYKPIQQLNNTVYFNSEEGEELTVNF